jgi:formylglycine-generating enzyme required for sulfatase activity
MSGSSATAAPRIFVSHSHKDDEFTRRLVSDLHAAGAEVWVDVAGISHGNFMQRIDEALQGCNWMVLVLTPNAIASQYVKDEVYTALHRVNQGYMRAVIPMLAAACTPGSIPPQWDVLQRYDATHNYTAALAGMLNALGLAQQITVPPVAQRPPAAAPPPARQALPRARFPERLERLGFAAALATDPTTGREVAFIRPPLCAVAAGPFRMGSDPKQDSEAYDREQPQITVDLPAYAIAKFPVTVAEYACFVDAGHAAPRKGYLGTDWQTQLTRLDHPVTCVSWYDARDYAAWLARLTGQPWALPSEAEWEKAARWDARGDNGHGHARIYPWGDRFEAARCNTGESGIKTTTAVGSYGPENPSRDGSSPYGAQDMAGNVWEWTRTIYDEQAYRTNTFREDSNSTYNRVLRGGSWDYNAWVARAAYRNDNPPGIAGVNFGFRVALLSAAPNSF